MGREISAVKKVSLMSGLISPSISKQVVQGLILTHPCAVTEPSRTSGPELFIQARGGGSAAPSWLKAEERLVCCLLAFC